MIRTRRIRLKRRKTMGGTDSVKSGKVKVIENAGDYYLVQSTLEGSCVKLLEPTYGKKMNEMVKSMPLEQIVDSIGPLQFLYKASEVAPAKADTNNTTQKQMTETERLINMQKDAYPNYKIREKNAYYDLNGGTLVNLMKDEVQTLTDIARTAYNEAFSNPPRDPVKDAENKFLENLKDLDKRIITSNNNSWEQGKIVLINKPFRVYSPIENALDRIRNLSQNKETIETIHKQTIAELAAAAAAAATIVLESAKEKLKYENDLKNYEKDNSKENRANLKKKMFLHKFITLNDLHLKVSTYDELLNYSFWINTKKTWESSYSVLYAFKKDITTMDDLRRNLHDIKVQSMYVKYKIKDLYKDKALLSKNTTVGNQIGTSLSNSKRSMINNAGVLGIAGLTFPCQDKRPMNKEYYENDMNSLLSTCLEPFYSHMC